MKEIEINNLYQVRKIFLNSKMNLKPLVYQDNTFKINNYLKTKKIYYKYQIKRNLLNINYDDKMFINNIYNNLLVNCIIDKKEKKKLRSYFGVSSKINKLIISNYFIFNNDVILPSNINITCNTNISIQDDLKYYLPKSLSYRTLSQLNEIGVYRICDLAISKVMLNFFEFSNLTRYIYDLKRYYLSDSLFESILLKNEITLFMCYLHYRSYKVISAIYHFSTTEIRARVYTIIKKLLKYFDSLDGIRVLDILFCKANKYLKISDLKEIFPKYYQIFLFLVENNYLYNIELINAMEIILIK